MPVTEFDQWSMVCSSGVMNFLAHIHLSGPDAQIICGNFIGDGVKGREVQYYPDQVQAGIALHHFIDTFTDTHPETAAARKLIRPAFRKYAGVVLDIYFDHFLSRHWETYHDEELEPFVESVHDVLEAFRDEMPEKSERFYHYMRNHNWLVNYRDLSALDRVFHGMARRSQFASNMEAAVPVLMEQYEAIEQTFHTFFPLLQKAALDYRASS